MHSRVLTKCMQQKSVCPKFMQQKVYVQQSVCSIKCVQHQVHVYAQSVRPTPSRARHATPSRTRPTTHRACLVNQLNAIACTPSNRCLLRFEAFGRELGTSKYNFLLHTHCFVVEISCKLCALYFVLLLLRCGDAVNDSSLASFLEDVNALAVFRQ